MVNIKLMILDVDGVLTSGELPYDAAGCEIKSFHVHDGSAIRLWQRHGGLTAIFSGRDSKAVERRTEELGIAWVRQGVEDKLAAYEEACRSARVEDSAVCVVGDDLADIPILRRCGYPVAVANAIPLVKRAARLITRRRGGEGAVAEAVEHLLRCNGVWSLVLSDAIGAAPRTP